MSRTSLRNVAPGAMVALVAVLVYAASACSPRAGALAPSEPEEFRGLFAHAEGASTLLPCGAGADGGTVEAVPITATPALLAAYARATRQGYPGQRIEVAFRGTRDPETGRVVVRDHSAAVAKTRHSACLPAELWALGNEPYWSLQVSRAEGVAEWSAIGEQTVPYAYAAPTVEEGGALRRYYFRGQQRLKVTVTEEACEDTMAGNRYPYRVRVERAGRVYEGCGQ